MNDGKIQILDVAKPLFSHGQIGVCKGTKPLLFSSLDAIRITCQGRVLVEVTATRAIRLEYSSKRFALSKSIEYYKRTNEVNS